MVNRGTALLRILMGIVFLSAAVYRIFNPDDAAAEMASLNLPQLLMFPMIALELLMGVLLLLGRYLQVVLPSAIGLMVLANGIGLWKNAATIAQTAGTLFVFDATATDAVLHLTFTIILIALLLSVQQRHEKT